jgi:spore coat polysaccharide biosynthesis predicted glycosyltransferase SpsG
MDRMLTKVTFRVDAGGETGMGHIVRCIALADELRKRGCLCGFWGSHLATRLALVQGHTAFERDDPDELPTEEADAWIVDLEGGCPPRLARRLCGLGRSLTILNGVGYPDGDPGRLLADLVFYQGVSWRPHELDWDRFAGHWHEGPEWLILRPEFAEHRRHRYPFPEHSPPRLLLAGGGADVGGVSHRVAEALQDTQVKLRVLIGPASPHFRTWDATLAEPRYNPRNVAEEMAWADAAVVSHGMTTYECLASGLPTLAYSITPDHEQSAALLSERSRGAVVSAGLIDSATLDSIRTAVGYLLTSAEDLSARGMNTVDGGGAARVADAIMATLTGDEGRDGG